MQLLMPTSCGGIMVSPTTALTLTTTKKCKLNYKYAVRAIKRNIKTIKADNVASNLINNNYNGFWNAVRKYNNDKEILPQQVGKTTGEKDICNKWKEHFSSIYNRNET